VAGNCLQVMTTAPVIATTSLTKQFPPVNDYKVIGVADLGYEIWCECRAPRGTHTKFHSPNQQRPKPYLGSAAPKFYGVGKLGRVAYQQMHRFWYCISPTMIDINLAIVDMTAHAD
jgi:hypothetical protein